MYPANACASKTAFSRASPSDRANVSAVDHGADDDDNIAHQPDRIRDDERPRPIDDTVQQPEHGKCQKQTPGAEIQVLGAPGRIDLNNLRDSRKWRDDADDKSASIDESIETRPTGIVLKLLRSIARPRNIGLMNDATPVTPDMCVGTE